MDSNPASLGVLSPNQGHTDRSPSVQAAQINKLIAQEAEFALGSHDPESAEKLRESFLCRRIDRGLRSA